MSDPEREIHRARRALERSVPEADLQANVIELALHTGWLHHHPYDSRRSTPGFPDLTLVRAQPARPTPGRLVFAELKAEDGQLTTDQQLWADYLRAVPGVEYYLWRPSDWRSGAIELVLAR